MEWIVAGRQQPTLSCANLHTYPNIDIFWHQMMENT
jgi:hypothetical protein